jgi:iron complex outermembrane receptor protein
MKPLASPLLAAALMIPPAASQENNNPDIYQWPLEDLLKVIVISASGVEESKADAPASIITISANEIRRRGYHSLNEVFADLPGFDSYALNGSRYLFAYQRGYRTPFMSRTLLMVNGRIQNHLWDHIAYAERQWPLTNIERIEVLYGPNSVIYGPNAFLGSINIVTRDGSQLDDGVHEQEMRASYGSWDTRILDINARGHSGRWYYSVAGKVYKSDEPGLDDFGRSYGWISDDIYGNRDIWGAINDLSEHGNQLNQYANPADNQGLVFEVGFDNFKFSHINWKIAEGYGPTNAADKAQAANLWRKYGTEYVIEHRGSAPTSENGTLEIDTIASYRTSRLNGRWAEAVPTGDDNRFSYISYSDWDTRNTAKLFKQDYRFRLNQHWHFNGGIKYEHKDLTKAFDVCGYWINSFCSSAEEAPGPLGFGAGVFDSRSGDLEVQEGTSGHIPGVNRNTTIDRGVFVQAIWDKGNWRLSGGVRYDNNSDFGSTVNPRASGVYRLDAKNRLKFLYGEAFQEPPNLQLYGGWNGRRANPDLEPETLKNYELVYIREERHWLHELSLYFTEFRNVVKEEAENAGEREVIGFEYHGTFSMENVLFETAPIEGYIYYTYTDNTSSIRYQYDRVDPGTGEISSGWFEGDTDIGDIAPHKLNLGLNIPLPGDLNLNVRAQWHSETELYSRNRLRSQGQDLDSYTIVHMALRYQLPRMALTVRVDNLLNEEYFLPGERAANAGNDYEATRSSGFQSSLIPTPQRSYSLSVDFQF